MINPYLDDRCRSETEPTVVRSHGTRTAAKVFAVSWLLLIFVLSFLPGRYKREFHTKGRLHSWDHLLAFAAGGFILVASTRSTRARVLVLTGAVLFGFSVEFVQHLLYRAEIEWRDVTIDILGLTLGCLMAIAYGRRTRDK